MVSSSSSASGIGSWWSMDDAISSTSSALALFLRRFDASLVPDFPRAIFDWSLSEGGAGLPDPANVGERACGYRGATPEK